MNRLFILSALSFLTVASANAKTAKLYNPVGIETCYSSEKRYNIAERGAIADGKTLNTKAIFGPTVLRLKLRPDTPQQYENISMSDIDMKDGGVIFKVSPWTQYFDLKGQAPPKALVRNIRISNVRGTGSSLGELTGHDQTVISDILVRNVDVQLKSTDFRVGHVQNLYFRNVKVNGKKMPVPATGNAMAIKTGNAMAIK